MGGTPWDQNKLPPIIAKLHPDVVMILLGVNDMVSSIRGLLLKNLVAALDGQAFKGRIEHQLCILYAVLALVAVRYAASFTRNVTCCLASS